VEEYHQWPKNGSLQIHVSQDFLVFQTAYKLSVFIFKIQATSFLLARIYENKDELDILGESK
jgi:hypothetical protein